MSIGQIVSNERSWTHLILFGDTNHQRLKNLSHLDRSTGVYWKRIEEVWTSRCKQHQDPAPSWNSLREIWGTSCPQHQDILPTDNQDVIYATIGTRPDIAFAAMRLSRCNNNPTEEHIKYTKYVLRYLKGTKELKIKYNGDSDAGLIGYSDSDWGEKRDDHHSTSGHVLLMANGAISWTSQWQKTVALSVGEAEYMELASIGQQAVWLKSLSEEIGFPIEGPIPLCSDNQAVIFLTINPAVECWTKHIDIRHHYIWEQYEEKVVKPFHVAGEENLADLFTKSLPVVNVEKFRSKIGLS